jgi:hypothetical protein
MILNRRIGPVLMFSLVYVCFTHSKGVLFESKDVQESVAARRVVEGCRVHPVTAKKECEANLKCFPQPEMNPPSTRLDF